MDLILPLSTVDESQYLLKDYAPALLGKLEEQYPAQLARSGPAAAAGSIAVRRLGAEVSAAKPDDIAAQYWSSRAALKVCIDLCNVGIPVGESRLRTAFRLGIFGKQLAVVGGVLAILAGLAPELPGAHAWTVKLVLLAGVVTIVAAALIVYGDGSVGIPELRETLSSQLARLSKARDEAHSRRSQLSRLDPVNEHHFDLINALTADVNALSAGVHEAIDYVFKVARAAVPRLEANDPI